MSETTDNTQGEEVKPTPKKRRPRKKKAEGLGDIVEAVTEATGIKSLVKAVAGDDCGCDKRKEKLNAAFPLLSNKRMTDEQKIVYETLVAPSVKSGQYDRLATTAVKKLNKDLGLAKMRITGCPSCGRRMVDKLVKIYEASCETS